MTAQTRYPFESFSLVKSEYYACDITIFGSGYVGLVTGACLADAGNHVVCVDIDERKIDMLKAGEVPIHEPGLDILVERNFDAGRLRFTTHAKEGVEHGQFQLIAVGTPPDEDGSADLRHVLAVAHTIGEHMSEYKVVVTKSTVPVGTADKVREAVAASLRARGAVVEYDTVSNPEFLKEGAAIADFMKPDRVVIGTDSSRATELMRLLYEPFTRNRDRMIVMDVRSAELTKYAANAMLATKISFMNELANLAEHFGADIEAVRIGIGSDPRIGYAFIYPGVGYGGSCFPKDVKALKHSADEVGYEAEHPARGRGGERAAKAGAVQQNPGAFRRSYGQDLRALGAVVQAQYRRHARGAEPGADGGAVGGGGQGPRLRPGGDAGMRSASTGGARISRCARPAPRPCRAPMRSPSSPNGRNFAVRISTTSRRR